MKQYIYPIIIFALGAIVGSFWPFRGEDTSGHSMIKTKLLELQIIDLQLSFDSLNVLISEKEEIVDKLRDHISALENQQNTIHIHHERKRASIILASDSELVCIIAGQQPDKDY